MTKRRPYLNSSIAELEQLVEQWRRDSAVLKRIADELHYRSTERAAQLSRKVEAILEGAELPLTTAPRRITLKLPPKAPVQTPSPEPAKPSTPPPSPLSSPGLRPPPVPVRMPVHITMPKPKMAPLSVPMQQPEPAPAPSYTAASAPAETRDDRRPMPEPAKPPVAAANPIVLNRMIDLIDYVIAVEKDKLKLVTDFADHRGLHRSHDEVTDLPGVLCNRVLGEDTAILTIERLNRKPPPETTDPVLKPWLMLADDTDREPALRQRLTAAECRAAALVIEPADAGLELAGFDGAEAVHAALATYRAGPWQAWARTEAPRRKSMAFYNALFALRQTLVAPDSVPQELVCGIGYAAIVRNGKRLHYPLLTIPLDVELDPVSHVIALVPRAEARPGVEADAPDGFGLAQVDTWRRLAKEQIESLDDDPLSPFVPSTFEAILQNAAALFDPSATYASGTVGQPLPIPTPGPQLRITDGFGFLQRERRATQLMADLQAFRDQLIASNGAIEIPAAISALFTDPSQDLPSEDFPTFRGINSIAGATSSDGSGADLFFPKPFNAEQVQIAQRLAVRDGVVVQGPPGTGKTHTIANIISHYLATGRRVLVTSQKSPALRVLQEQLPPQIRPLAVSLLDSDREGLRQFRGSVDLIAEKLQHLRKVDLDNEIMALEARIDGLHRRLAANDRETEQIGRSALSAVALDGQSIEPVDAAREVLAAGEEATWLPDAIGPASSFDADFGDEEIAALRTARQAVGVDLSYLGKKLPPADLLDDPDVILSAHENLQRADAIQRRIAAGTVWQLAQPREGMADVEATERQLVQWNQRREAMALTAGTLDDELAALLARPGDPILAALRGLRDEAAVLAEDQRFFLTRPVELPAGCMNDLKFREKVSDLASGGAGLSAIAGIFARTTKAHLAAVRLKGKAPVGDAEWQAVARFIDASDRALTFVKSWNHARDGSGVPGIEVVAPSAGRAALDVLDRLEGLVALQRDAEVLSQAVRGLLPRWSGSIGWKTDPSDVLDCLHLHLELSRLQAARSVRKAVREANRDVDTDVDDLLCALAANIGEANVSRTALAGKIAHCADRLRHLHSLLPHLDMISLLSCRVEACGAPLWAQQLRSVPAGAIDLLCPADWRKRWRLRRLDRWLDDCNLSARLRELHKDRETTERDLSATYVRAIEQRTWRALKEKASPHVMQALSAYAVAIGKIGRGTGKSANRYRKAARQAANAVKGALPCWIMPHSRVSESLPAEFGIFDLVIVDEASQSTLASLPALFRAKQILVVGDDKQVSPDNVGLNMEQANALAARHLGSQVPMFVEPMRQESSLYDLASVIFGADRFMLREHFRCAAPIIEFSKRQFYRDELCPLRVSKASERLDPVLSDVLVLDGYRKGKGKTNPPEADFILAELKRIGDNPIFDNRTIGVTTLLGTEQAALIDQRIRNELGIPFIEKYQVRVGDPAVFQGDERDIMFLSMVATPGNASALSGVAYEQRFNVAASRARERMILVRSVELEQLSPNDKLRRALLEHFRSPFPNDTEQAADAFLRCESDFEREVFQALFDRGYALDTQVRVGQYRIDMVVEGDEDRRLAIECDGDRYHGPEQWPADMQRQRTLERAGWRFWRCFASRFVRERAVVLDELCALLDSMDIKPRTARARSTIYTELRTWQSDTSQEGGMHAGDLETLVKIEDDAI